MLKNLIILPDGTEVSSGARLINNIRSVTLTECVNLGEELTLGSVCSAMLEARIQTIRGALALTAGDEVTLYKVDDAGKRHKVGLFILEKPTRPTANIIKLTGYDRVIRLDKDLSSWLKGLTGWPYDLLTFARMVCDACGLVLETSSIPNGNFMVQKFSKSGVTGRQLMRWIGEICCRFCRATADGKIELAWYTPAEYPITATGDHIYFRSSLTFEEYQTADIDAVQLKLADSDDAYLWPVADEGANSYIISGNPLLNRVTADSQAAIQNLQSLLAEVTYTPCKVSVPASLDIHAGNTVKITDRNGATITAYVMTKTQKGQRDTLECTGSPRRDSASVLNNRSPAEIAQERVDNQTQDELFNKLTKNGAIQGLFMKDGQLYINVAYLAAGIIKSVDGSVQIDLAENKITCDGKDTLNKPTRLSIEGSTLRIDRDDEEDGTYSLALMLQAMAAGAQLFAQYLAIAGNTGTEIGSENEGSVTLVKGSEVRVIAPKVSITGYEEGVIISGKSVSWLDNGDGNFTLIGT